jgi:DNA-binding NarL/FixJ family response regulator
MSPWWTTAPDEDRLAVALALKALPHPQLVLIYSAYADHALALAAIIAGADATLSNSTGARMWCARSSRWRRAGHSLPTRHPA